jgi:C-terminal processing protease CtpA/Prc
VVFAVRQGGNAYKNNIFSGDIILSVNGEPVGFDRPPLLLKKDFDNVVKIIRYGREITKIIRL